jgi:RNA polymerase sigma factor (sigma-70 family)
METCPRLAAAALDGTDDRLFRWAVRRFLPGLRDAADVDDARQEAALAAVTAARDYDPDRGGLLNWAIIRIRSALQLWEQRRKRRGFRRAPTPARPPVLLGSFEAADDLPFLAVRPDSAEAGLDAAALLAGLSARDREALDLHYRQGWTAAELAERWGMTTSGAASRIATAVEHARRPAGRPVAKSRKGWPAADVQLARRLRAEGHTFPEIGRRLGRSANSVRCGLDKRKGNP